MIYAARGLPMSLPLGTVSGSQHVCELHVPKLNAELTLELTKNLIRGHGLAGFVAVDDGGLLVHFL